MRKHIKFILTPISRLLDDAANAVSGIEQGFVSYPLCEYIVQSLFLRMTGFQEQKMKCISWELATEDYKYRYERFRLAPLGECSTYREKNIVFKDLLGQLKKRLVDNVSLDNKEKENVISEAKAKLKEFNGKMQTKGWLQKAYFDFDRLISKCSHRCILFVNGKGEPTEIFGHCENCANHKKDVAEGLCKADKLSDVYERIIAHRNRCAHNTTSYQQNLPTIETMDDDGSLFNNYYIYFFFLIVIDEIFIKLFRRYMEAYNTDFVL